MPNNQPNILLITTDQQRFDTCGPRAPSFMRTPHFDHLCREGVRFDSAYADCPICVPARVSIMTGQYATTHGMLGNGSSSDAMGRADTLPTCLRELGYQTCAVGKMHFTPERTRHGFDEMILPSDYYRQMARSGSPVQPMRHGLGQNELYPTLATVPETQTLTSWIAEQCVEYILHRRDPGVPFFLWCSFSKPHPPLDPPEPYYSMYRNCDIPDPVIGDWSEGDSCPEPFRRGAQAWSLDLLPPEVIREARSAYYGLITQIDYNMGRVFAALQDIDLFRDALILYTSDHGELVGDHHAGAKSYFYEGAAHVPFALRMPKSWEDRCHGTVATSPVTHADILPTLVTAAGGTPPAGVDGLDLAAVARGQTQGRDYLEASVHGHPYFAITDGRWKYIVYPEGGTEQLFDLETDPDEKANLAGRAGCGAQQEALRVELVRRHKARGSGAVENGAFKTVERRGDPEADRRNSAWPGYHTETYPVDVRH